MVVPTSSGVTHVTLHLFAVGLQTGEREAFPSLYGVFECESRCPLEDASLPLL